MAEVKKVSGKMQPDTEGGLVCATFEMVVESGATKAGLGNEEAAGGSTGEIGVTKAAAGRSTPEIGVTKAAAGTSTPEIGVTKAAAVSSSPAIAIGLTKAWLEKAAASSEFGVTKAMLNKYVTGTCMLAAASCIKLPAGSVKPKEEGKAETVVAPVTKERVPDAYIERIKRRPSRKMRPLAECIAADKPEIREKLLATNAHIDYLVDLEQDCLRQYKEKGYAEIGVDYTGAFKKVFILPNPVVQAEGKGN